MTAPLRVLIVEDEAIVAMMLEDMVSELGHEVAGVVGRLDQALTSANTLDIGLAIVDLNLNGERTYPVAGILSDRGVPFIFATGDGPEGLSEQWRNTPVLRKPFQMEELERAIADATART